MSGETVFETPWFLQSATTEVGRVNKIVEDRLQRSITEINFKQKKSVEKIKTDRRGEERAKGHSYKC